jgi:DNA-binding GntR family transcriptional regulator
MDMRVHESGGKSVAAYRRIKQLATDGMLRPRERLCPLYFAQMLHISATPVREALARLYAEGYVSWEANRGYFTKQQKIQEQTELHHLLFILERGSLETDIHKFHINGNTDPLALVDDADREASQIMVQETEGSLTSFMELILDRIASLNNNLTLRHAVNVIVDRTHLIRWMDLEDADTSGEARKDARTLVRALTAHDVTGALSALRMRLEKRLRRLPELVDKVNARMLHAELP